MRRNLGALEGLKVVDMTVSIAGPLATKCLSDFGAQVVKVEWARKPEVLRVAMPFKDGKAGINRAGLFVQMNTGKYSIALDLKSEAGKEVMTRLIKWGDLFVENFTPGAMEGLGFSYEAVRKINPSISMVRMSLQGQTGPGAGLRGWGVQVKGLAGFTYHTGWPDREGTGPGIAYTDPASALLGTVALLGCAIRRKRIGRGQLVDLSQVEAGLTYLTPHVLDYHLNGRIPGRAGNADPDAAPHAVFACKGTDKWCAVAVFTEEQWQGFKRVLGDPAWCAEKRFADLDGRKNNEDELDRLVEAWTIGQTRRQVMELMQGRGVPAGMIEGTDDLMDGDEHLRARGYFGEIQDQPEIGRCRFIGWPNRFSSTPFEVKPSPTLGQHNEYVCMELLKMSREEFTRLMGGHGSAEVAT